MDIGQSRAILVLRPRSSEDHYIVPRAVVVFHRCIRFILIYIDNRPRDCSFVGMSVAFYKTQVVGEVELELLNMRRLM